MTDPPGPFSATPPPPPPPPPPGPPPGPPQGGGQGPSGPQSGGQGPSGPQSGGQGPPPPGWWQASDGRWYPPQAAPAGYPQYGQPHGVAPKNNGLAIASLVLSVVWLYWIGSILAIILGIVALRQIDRSGGAQKGRGFAMAGLVIGLATILLVVVAIAAVTLLGDSSTSGY